MSDTIQPRPFLKWAGGKRQLIAELRRYAPHRIPRYFEPFLGSGALFFELTARGQLTGPAVLADVNVDLIGTYLRLRDALDEVVDELTALADAYARRGRDLYYEVRDGRFNPERDAWRRRGGAAGSYPPRLAAMLLFLNRTGYNGLFRLNASGHFNVPAGRHRSLRILNVERLRQASEVLKAAHVTLRHASFDEALDGARDGDFVYLDPPYAPLTATSNFRAYTAQGFGLADQVRLRDVCIALAQRGVRVVLSNSTAPEVIALYAADDARDAGLRCWRVPARRAINSRAERRGAIDELIVSNVTPRRR